MIEKPSAAVAVVGAGPRGTRMLERIAAHAPGILGRQRLEIHLVDPYPREQAGSGATSSPRCCG